MTGATLRSRRPDRGDAAADTSPAVARTPPPRPKQALFKGRHVGWLLVAVPAATLLLFPLYWMAVSSVTPIGDLLSLNLRLIPDPNQLQLGVYSHAFSQYPLLDWLLNSSLVTLGAVALSLVAAVPAGYALTRIGSGGATAAGFLLLFTA